VKAEQGVGGTEVMNDLDLAATTLGRIKDALKKASPKERQAIEALLTPERLSALKGLERGELQHAPWWFNKEHMFEGKQFKIADLAARTRENKLKPDELGGATFTLTNTGSRGALFDTPVVFLPQVAILGTGIVTKRPVVVTDAAGNDSIAIRSMVYLALSYDHRLVDGADASRFLVDVKNRLEGAAFDANLGI
jgi:hypothetical protein